MFTGYTNTINLKFIFGLGALYILLACAAMIYLMIDSGLFEKERTNLIKDINKVKNVISGLQLLGEKGEANGYAPLGPDGIIPDEFIPAFLDNVQFSAGCWNAQTNTPVITGGVGTNGETYIVCFPGNTPIDGTSEWGLFDFVVFSSDLGMWIRLDLTRNVIQDSTTLQPGDVSVVKDGQGPKFELCSIEAGSNVQLSYDGSSGTYFFTYTGIVEETTLSDPGTPSSLLGSSFIYEQGPSNMAVRSLVGSTNADLSESASSVNIRRFPDGNLAVSSGVFNVDFISPVLTPVRNSGKLSFGYIAIGRMIRLSTVIVVSGSVTFSDVDINLPFYAFSLDLSSATDPFIANAAFENIQGQVITTSRGVLINTDIEAFQTLTGACELGGTNQIMDCTMTGGELPLVEFINPPNPPTSSDFGIMFLVLAANMYIE